MVVCRRGARTHRSPSTSTSSSSSRCFPQAPESGISGEGRACEKGRRQGLFPSPRCGRGGSLDSRTSYPGLSRRPLAAKLPACAPPRTAAAVMAALVSNRFAALVWQPVRVFSSPPPSLSLTMPPDNHLSLPAAPGSFAAGMHSRFGQRGDCTREPELEGGVGAPSRGQSRCY